MNFLFSRDGNTLSPTISRNSEYLGPEINSYYSKYDSGILFESTEHELNIFGIGDVKPANYYLLSELPKDDIEKNIPSDDPSWKWYVIGNFGTKDESIIVDSQTQKIYLFNWTSYPKDQKEIAGSFDDLLFRLDSLGEDESIQDL